MDRIDWSSRLKQWLGRHPLKEPPPESRDLYVKEVMARIQAPAARNPLSPPGLLLLAGAAACLLLLVFAGTLRKPTQPPEQETQLLAVMEESRDLSGVDLEAAALLHDRLMLLDTLQGQSLQLLGD